MSYRLEISESLSALFAGNGKILGSIIRAQAFQSQGLIQRVEITVSNLDNKFSIGDKNLLKAGLFFLFFVDDKEYIGGEIDEVNPFEDSNTLRIVGFSWESRLNIRAAGATRILPGRKTNAEVVTELLKIVYPETEAKFSIDSSFPAFVNNEIRENEQLLKKLQDIALFEGYTFFISPRLEISFVNTFIRTQNVHFQYGKNITNVRQEISLSETFNEITVIGRKAGQSRTIKNKSTNSPSEFLVARETNKASVTDIGRKSRQFFFPQFNTVADITNAAAGLLERFNKISYRFVFETPLAGFLVNAEVEFTHPDFKLVRSSGWKVELVNLLMDVSTHKAQVFIGKKFKSPFSGKIS